MHRLPGLRAAPFALAVTALVAACAPAAATPSAPASTRPAASPSATRPRSPTVTGSPSPSSTATASASPAPAASRTPAPVPSPVSDLVVKIDAQGDTCCGVTSVVVAADGTYLASSAEFTRDYTVRQLTGDGVRAVRERILATRLLGSDASFGLVARPGVQPPAHGATGLSFLYRDGGRSAHVSFTLLPTGEEQYYEPSPERDTLAALAIALRSPETWLAPSAWKDPTPRAFVAASYSVISGPGPVVGPPGPPFELAKVAWPFATPLPAFGDPIVPSGQPVLVRSVAWYLDGPARCQPVTRADALAIRDALSTASAPISTFPSDGFGVQGALNEKTFVLLVLPTLPAAPPCAGDLL